MGHHSQEDHVSTSSRSEKQLLSLAEVAQILGVSERTARRYVSEGHMECRRLGAKTLRIPAASVEAFIDSAPVGNAHEIAAC